ncbi:MAG: hypothetical protein V2B13_02985 [Pseudomonadota bacterium]
MGGQFKAAPLGCESFADFQTLLINATPLPPVLKGVQPTSHRERLLFILKELEKIPRGKAPFLTCHFSFLDRDHFIRQASKPEYVEWRHPEQINLRERMANFTACYFFDQNYGKCYPQITPVNILRIVLNQFFGLNLVASDDVGFFGRQTSV